MRVCMFHPNDHPLERGWVGRIDGTRVLHLAAQTLQSFFLGGGGAREHAEYPLDDVTFLAPVQFPPTLRLFATDGSFRFGNASAVSGDNVPVLAGADLRARARLAAVIGAEGAIGGYSALLEWVDPAEQPDVKQSDFSLVLGPTVVTPDEIDPGAVAYALRAGGRGGVGQRRRRSPGPTRLRSPRRRTSLRPGDVLAGPPLLTLAGVGSGVELEVEGIGTLRCPVA